MAAPDATRVAASLVRLGPKTQAAAYAITKRYGAILKKRVQERAPSGATKYRSSIKLRSTGATGNPKATVSRALGTRRTNRGRPSFLRDALAETAPGYVAAIAAIPMNLD